MTSCTCLLFRPTFRILSGYDTDIYRYPWMISIRNGSGYHVCGGSLIRVNPHSTRTDVGLTAAHCFRSYLVRGRPLNAFILAGATVNSFNDTSGEKRRIIDVKSYGFFPGDDAAVIKFESPIEFNDRMKPLDMPIQGKNVPRDAQCVVTGWGLDQHNALQELPVTLQACDGRKFEYGNVFCAGGATGAICSGDSGGPLVCRNENGTNVQQGIVSYSDPSCGDHPASYSRVSFYADWINETAKKMSSLTSHK